ncbi:[citrate (pro-3S)-lyase] ligase [Aminivibrio sp.]
MFGLEERLIATKYEKEERRRLLLSRGLAEPGGEELILGFYLNDRLVATGSLVGNILQGIAVEGELEGEGLASTVTGALLKKGMERGLIHFFLYSKPEEARLFEGLGFSFLASAKGRSSGLAASLLEWGRPDIASWRAFLKKESEGKPDGAGCVVVNCNPFTLGHSSLLEYASALVPWLYVLVVQEDKSLFPFEVRLRLVREGSAGLANVTVLPGGPYVISSATFPTYFTRLAAGGREEGITELHAALDLEMFRRHIAPPLRVTSRFVGTEPFCPVTSLYNETMKEILPAGKDGFPPVAVREMPRYERKGTAVSASRVRELLHEGRLEDVEELVPETTWNWLTSPEARPILEKIRKAESRH